jgi:hypothetical protein
MEDAETSAIVEQEADTPYRKKCRANWARLIQKIYEIDPLTCPNCGGTMRILAFIEEAAVIRKILDHLGLWDVPKRQPKRGREPPVIAVEEPLLVYADSQVIEYEEAYYIPEYL